MNTNWKKGDTLIGKIKSNKDILILIEDVYKNSYEWSYPYMADHKFDSINSSDPELVFWEKYKCG